MKALNIEIKAICHDQDKIRSILNSNNAYFKGIDRQIDKYFKTNFGRLNIDPNVFKETRVDNKLSTQISTKSVNTAQN